MIRKIFSAQGGIARSSLLVVTMLTLNACMMAPPEPTQFVMEDVSQNGVLALSITYDMFSGYTIYYRGIDDPKVTGYLKAGKGVMLLPIKPAGDFQNYGLEGEVVIAKLPAGRYQMFGFGMQSGPWIGSSKDKTDLIVRVVPGAVTYTGNFHFAATGRFGLSVTSFRVDLSDKFDRDKDVLTYKHIGIDSLPILKGIPDGFHEKGITGSTSDALNFETLITEQRDRYEDSKARIETDY